MALTWKIGMLPDELLFAIFNDTSLDLNELLELRLVNKRFNRLVQRVRITKLAIRNRRQYLCGLQTGQSYFNQLFKFLNEPIGTGFTLETSRQSNGFQKSRARNQMLSKLKQLSIDYLNLNRRNGNRKNFLTFLKQLKELESLQIFSLQLDPKGVKNISLPTIRILSIIRFESSGAKLQVNAPELSKLAFLDAYPHNNNSRLDLLELVHPQTLEEIELKCYHPQLVRYSNLKTIRFKNEKLQNSLSVERIFIDFPKLEFVYFGITKRNHFHFYDEGLFTDYEWLGQKLGELVRSRRKHRNLNVKLYVMDFKIENQTDIDDLFGSSSEIDVDNTRLVLNNYGKLASVTTAIRKINYIEVANYFGNTIPSDFHQRFVNIRSVSLDRKEDEKSPLDQNSFVNFIAKCQVLNVLELNHVDLDPVFYARLHLRCPYLSTLRIELEKKDKKLKDISFILSLQNLNEFSINRPINFMLINRAFTDLKSFRILKCKLKGKPIEIDRSSQRKFFKISNKNINPCQNNEFLKALHNLFALAGLA